MRIQYRPVIGPQQSFSGEQCHLGVIGKLAGVIRILNIICYSLRTVLAPDYFKCHKFHRRPESIANGSAQKAAGEMIL
jgi:hypothetical protein